MAERWPDCTCHGVGRPCYACSTTGGASSTAPGEPKPDTPIVFAEEDLRAT